MTDVSSKSSSPDDKSGHELDDVSVRWMTLTGIGLLGLVIATLTSVAVGFRELVPNSPRVTVNQQSRQELMTPGVKPNQAYDRQRIEAAQRTMLSQYGWQDKRRSFARIPIKRAIELMAQHKLRIEWPQAESAESPVPATNSPEKEER